MFHRNEYNTGRYRGTNPKTEGPTYKITTVRDWTNQNDCTETVQQSQMIRRQNDTIRSDYPTRLIKIPRWRHRGIWPQQNKKYKKKNKQDYVPVRVLTSRRRGTANVTERQYDQNIFSYRPRNARTRSSKIINATQGLNLYTWCHTS